MTYLTETLSIDMYAFFMLLFIYIMSRRRGDRISHQRKIFHRMVAAAMLLLAANAGTCFTAACNLVLLEQLVWFFAYLLYIPILWMAFRYFRCNIFSVKGQGKGWLWGMGSLCLMDGLLTLATPWTGWYYLFDGQGIYHRGPWFALHLMLLSLGILVLAVMALRFHRRLDASRFYSLLFFLVPPGLCAGLLLLTGANLVAGGIAFSLMVIFVTIQSRDLITDFLTGACNRRQLEWILQERIRNAEQQGFGAIMVDIDSFKRINDEYGHDAGDDALRNTADILRRCVRLRDVVARYGGDEFWVVISGQLQAAELMGIVHRIEAELRYFNEFSAKPYHLSLSMGYGVYDPASGMDAQQFQKHIDGLMYSQKKAHHQECRRQEDRVQKN